MPYRKANLRRGQLSGTTETHLLAGRCLIGFACQICTGCPGECRGREPYTLNAAAKEVWEKHRERLLTLWKDPEGRRAGSSGFCGEGLRGAGRLGLPCWSEIKFEKAKLPKLNKAWPKDIKEAWAELKDR